MNELLLISQRMRNVNCEVKYRGCWAAENFTLQVLVAIAGGGKVRSLMTKFPHILKDTTSNLVLY